jgi:hypothetical protein
VQVLGAPAAGDAWDNSSRMTLAAMTIDVLRERPEGTDKRAVIELIHQKHGVVPATNSLTTLLSRLKSQRVLSRDGRVWRVNEGRL